LPHAVGASALATAEMRYQLTQQLGVRWRPAHHGSWEIDGIPDPVLRAFSQRRSDIDDAIAELEDAIGRASTIDELQRLVTATRPAKRQADVRDLLGEWWRRAHQLRFAPRRLAACLHRTRQPPARPSETWLFTRLSARDGICANGSVFTRDDVLAALANVPVPATGGRPQPLLVPAAELELLGDAFLASHHVIELHPPADHHRLRALRDEPLYTTAEILHTQQRIIDRYQRHVGAAAALVRADLLEAVLTDHPHLTAEQRQLVRGFCTSGAQTQCAVGRAGAGKTTTMRAAVTAWQAVGYRVLGTAVKGEAARHLGATAGIPAETLAWYLARRNSSRPPLDARTVLIVDEASTVSDRDLDALLDLAERTGAALRLIGDPAQHGA
ncbi:MAG: AAA family ATPase, partial [Acidimicrobiales bacterium]